MATHPSLATRAPNGDDSGTATTGVEAELTARRRRRRRDRARLIGLRILAAAAVLWAAITLTFIAIQLTPGDTVALLLGENRDDPQLRAETIARWGLDQPLWVQYLTYLARIPSGDFGVSYNLRKPVSELVITSLGPTIQLAVSALVVAVLIAVAASLLTSTRSPLVRRVTGLIELVLVSAPPFWLAIVLLAVVSFGWGLFSIVDTASWQSLILPTAALALPMGAYLTQILRDGLDRAGEQPFAVTARARGLSPLGLRTRHSLRHAALPATNIVGLMFGSLLGGAVIVEQVFGRSGLGQIAVDAVTVKDVPLILGVTLVTTAAFVIASTVVDVVALLIDPRLRTRSTD